MVGIESGQLLPVGAPHLLIDARCAVSLVGRHSLNGQKFGRAGVREHPLQRFGLAEALCLDCFGNTHLQAWNSSPDLVPGQEFPFLGQGDWVLSRERTDRSVKIDHPLLFLVGELLRILLPRETRSTWAYPLHYRAALAFSILSMPLPLGLPCGGPALVRTRARCWRLFHVPRRSQEGLGPLYTPGVRHSRRTNGQSPNLTPYRFGPSLKQPRVACSD
jgi:hypothetical protein